MYKNYLFSAFVVLLFQTLFLSACSKNIFSSDSGSGGGGGGGGGAANDIGPSPGPGGGGDPVSGTPGNPGSNPGGSGGTPVVDDDDHDGSVGGCEPAQWQKSQMRMCKQLVDGGAHPGSKCHRGEHEHYYQVVPCVAVCHTPPGNPRNRRTMWKHPNFLQHMRDGHGGSFTVGACACGA